MSQPDNLNKFTFIPGGSLGVGLSWMERTCYSVHELLWVKEDSVTHFLGTYSPSIILEEQKMTHIDHVRESLRKAANGQLVHEGGKFIIANENLCNLFGYTEAELLSIPSVVSLLEEKYREDAIRRIQAEEEGKYRAVAIRKNGERFHVQMEVENSIIDQKKVRIVSFADITDLVEMQEYLWAIHEHAPMGIYTVDQKWNFTYVNPVFEKTFGYSREELLSMNFLDLVHSDDFDLVKERWRDRIDGKPSESGYEIRLQDKERNTRLFEVNATRISRKWSPSLVWVLRDITKEREQERAMSLFAMCYGHDTKNGLQRLAAAITNTQNKIWELDIPESTRQCVLELLNWIEWGNTDLIKMAYEVLHVEQVILGKINVRSVKINLKEYTDALVTRFKWAANEKDVELIMVNEWDMDSFFSDKEVLWVIVNNLVWNAVKFTRKNTKITICIKRIWVDNDAYTKITIQDQWEGLSTEDFARTSMPLDDARRDVQNMKETSKNPNRWHGLGLDTSRFLADKIDWRLYVEENMPWVWVRFAIEVPDLSCVSDRKDSIVDLSKECDWPEESWDILFGKSILVVEDVRDSWVYAKRIFQQVRCDVDVVKDAETAIGRMRKKQYDIVFVDMQLIWEWMQWDMLIDYIRSPKTETWETLRDVCIIANSASPLEEEKAYNSGANTFIGKPYTIMDLLARARDLLSKTQ